MKGYKRFEGGELKYIKSNLSKVEYDDFINDLCTYFEGDVNICYVGKLAYFDSVERLIIEDENDSVTYFVEEIYNEENDEILYNVFEGVIY